MPRILIVLLVCLFTGPADGWAGRYHSGSRVGIRFQAQPKFQGNRSQMGSPLRQPTGNRLGRHRFPSRLPSNPHPPGKPVHPIYPGDKPCRPGYQRPGYGWPVTGTVVRETETIIVVNTPPPAEPPPPPEPEKVWVPPVMDTRTEPGYWDYGVKKVWMGDHWRYEQDLDIRTWVPESQVRYVKQAGYWTFAE